MSRQGCDGRAHQGFFSAHAPVFFLSPFSFLCPITRSHNRLLNARNNNNRGSLGSQLTKLITFFSNCHRFITSARGFRAFNHIDTLDAPRRARERRGKSLGGAHRTNSFRPVIQLISLQTMGNCTNGKRNTLLSCD